MGKADRDGRACCGNSRPGDAVALCRSAVLHGRAPSGKPVFTKFSLTHYSASTSAFLYLKEAMYGYGTLGESITSMIALECTASFLEGVALFGAVCESAKE